MGQPEHITTTQRIILVCPKCESSNIVRDAIASWDTTKQEWVHADVYESMACNDCGWEFKAATEVVL